MNKGGVRPPSGTTYVPEIPDNDPGTRPTQLSPKPQISRNPDQTSGSELLQRRATSVSAGVPQVNRKMRQKIALTEACEQMQAERQNLAIQQRIAQHMDQLKDAVFNQNPGAGNFTIFHIDDEGYEVAIIPPDPLLLANPQKQVWLLNQLKQDLLELDEHFSDDAVEELEESMRQLDEQLEDARIKLNHLQGKIPPARPVPDYLYLDLEWLTTARTESPRSQPDPVQTQTRPPLPENRPDAFVLDTSPAGKTVQFTGETDGEEKLTRQWLDSHNDPTYKIPGQRLTLEEIRGLSEEQMEERDDFLPLMFPGRLQSSFNPDAPALSNQMLEAITSDPDLREEIGESVDQMLEFWGLERDDNDNVVAVQGEEERHKRWLSLDETVDQQRLVHTLDFLMDIGEFTLAENLEKTLQNQLRLNQIAENTHWANAVGRESQNPQPAPNTNTRTRRKAAVAPTPPPKKHKIHSYREYVQAYPYGKSHLKPKVEFYHKTDPYYSFTNFYKPDKPINIDGVDWPTTEHYFQACKFTPGSQPWNDIRLNIPNAGDVFRYVHPKDKPPLQMSMTPEQWDAQKDQIMLKALRAKAMQVEEFRTELLSTRKKVLYETSDRDSYWGTAKNQQTGKDGENHLGAMLMQVRDELIAAGWDKK